MKTCLLNTIGFLITFLMLFGQARAEQFLLQDQHGVPIKNAVLEFSISSTPPSGAASPNTLIMDQVNKRFKPDVLVIHQGDFVSFPNSDNIRHHVYSFSQVKPFELKLYSGKPKAPLQFENAGVSVLGCNIHDAMVGYIYIASSTQVLMTNEHGMATLDNSIKFDHVSVWHSNLSSALTSPKQISYENLVKNANNATLFIINVDLNSPEPPNTFQSIFKNNGQ